MNGHIDSIEVLKWDDLGIDVQFKFVKPTNVSNGIYPVQMYGSVNKDNFYFFISKENRLFMDEEAAMNITVPS